MSRPRTPLTAEAVALIGAAAAAHVTIELTEQMAARQRESRLEAILLARKAGATLQAIADGMGISRQRVAEIAKQPAGEPASA